MSGIIVGGLIELQQNVNQFIYQLIHNIQLRLNRTTVECKSHKIQQFVRFFQWLNRTTVECKYNQLYNRYIKQQVA